VLYEKVCSKCKERKPLDAFAKNRAQSDGYAWYCKPCNRSYQSRWAGNTQRKKQIASRKSAYNKENREKVKAQQDAWVAVNRDKVCASAKRHRALHPGRVAAASAKYREENSGKRAHWQRLREVGKKQAIPKWASLEAIQTIYETCPAGYHVDHVIPLKAMRDGEHVACGLHCEGNLQHLPAAENIRKWANLPES